MNFLENHNIEDIRRYLSDVENYHILRMCEITDEEWQRLDYMMESYNRNIKAYYLEKLPLLKFVLLKCYNNSKELRDVPTFIVGG